MTSPDRDSLEVAKWVGGVRAGDKGALAQAITLVESRRPDRRQRAQQLLAELLPQTGGALRVGISGLPGVGKSTLIERLGLDLVEAGHRVAVLAIDPSSTLSGGSILGDKSRMSRLAQEERAFIRPSPTALTLGGVARRTRETILLCEAAGYDVVLVETVGVGQSETTVSGMVDFLLVLMLPGAGDEMQGMKKGLIELADGIAINKADGESERLAETTAAEYAAALTYLRPRSTNWRPEVVTISARTGRGVAELWSLVERHRKQLIAAGEWEKIRRSQRRAWLWSEIESGLVDTFRSHPRVRTALADVEQRIEAGEITPEQGAQQLFDRFLHSAGE